MLRDRVEIPPEAELAPRPTSGPPLDAERIVRTGCAVAIALVAFQTLAHLANSLLFDEVVWNLNADQDGNALAWLSSVVTWTAGVAAVALAAARPELRARLLALAAILAFFSLDDVLALHEALGSYARGDLLDLPSGYGRLLWPVVFGPLLVGAAILTWDAARRVPSAAARPMRWGLGLLVVAVLAEIASTALHVDSRFTDSALDAIQVAIEEGAELGGWVLIATGLAAAAHAAVARGSAAHDGDGVAPDAR